MAKIKPAGQNKGRGRSAEGPKTKASPASDPAFLSVGLPRVPAHYGLKARKQFLPWKHARERLERSRNYWICTTRPDGRPHSIPVWGFWIEDTLYFGTARNSRKGRNLAQNPAVSVHLESGDDVVILEGQVVEVRNADILRTIDLGYRTKYKIPLNRDPETVVYSVRPRLVMAWTERNYPNDATRWELAQP